MSEFNRHRRTQIAEMTPWEPGFDMAVRFAQLEDRQAVRADADRLRTLILRRLDGAERAKRMAESIKRDAEAMKANGLVNDRIRGAEEAACDVLETLDGK